MQWTIHFVGSKTDAITVIEGNPAVGAAVAKGLISFIENIPEVPDPNDTNWTGGNSVKIIANGENDGIFNLVGYPFNINPPVAVPLPPAAPEVAAS